jgi:hypothetical protein
METCSNGMFQCGNTAFRAHSSQNSRDYDIKSNSLSNSPQLKNENCSTMLTSNETCRTIVSLLINQRKTNISLEQHLKQLQSTNKATTSQSPFESNSNQSSTIKRFTTHSLASSSSSSSSNSTGYSSGSSSSTSSVDSNSTILSAYSSRSNSSLSERSKTSPTPLKQIPIQYLPRINESNIHIPITTTDDEVTQLTSFNENKYSNDLLSKQSPIPSTSEQFQNKTFNKRRKTLTFEV